MDDYDELMRKADNGELSRESLQDQLNEYAEAMRQEFAIASASEEDPEVITKHVRNFFRKNLHSAAAQIVFLSQNSTSDAVRLSACKYICHEATQLLSNEDPIKDIFAELSAKPPAR